MDIPKFTPKNDFEKEMWAYVNEVEEFTHSMISKAVDVSDNHRVNFIAKLKRKGLIEECGTKDLQKLFTIHSTDKRRKIAEKRRKSPEGVMWSVMRVSKTFTYKEVYLAIGHGRPDITLKMVNTYCQKLMTAGYLRVMQRAKPPSTLALYMLINDTGPLPPTPKRKEVIIDANTGQVAFVHGAQL